MRIKGGLCQENLRMILDIELRVISLPGNEADGG